MPAVQWGIAVSVVLSVFAGWLFSRAANQALWEGVLALVAAVSVASLTVHMWRTARRIKGEIEGQLQQSSALQGGKAWLGVFLFTLLMISREGMETALLMGTLIFQVRAFDIIMGAAAGTVVAAIVAWLWSRYGHRVNLGLFFQVTAIFLLLFVVQLLIYGFHELTEANLFPGSEALALGHRAVRTRRHLRSVPDLPADRRPTRLAAGCDGQGRSDPTRQASRRVAQGLIRAVG